MFCCDGLCGGNPSWYATKTHISSYWYARRCVWCLVEYILKPQLFVTPLGLSHTTPLDIVVSLSDLVSFPFFHIFISCSESSCYTTDWPTIGPVLRTNTCSSSETGFNTRLHSNSRRVAEASSQNQHNECWIYSFLIEMQKIQHVSQLFTVWRLVEKSDACVNGLKLRSASRAEQELGNDNEVGMNTELKQINGCRHFVPHFCIIISRLS